MERKNPALTSDFHIYVDTYSFTPDTHTWTGRDGKEGDRNGIHCHCLRWFFVQPCVEQEIVWFWEHRAYSHTNLTPGTCRWLRWREEWEQGLGSWSLQSQSEQNWRWRSKPFLCRHDVLYTPMWATSDFTMLFTFPHICQVGARVILTLLNMKTLRVVLRKRLAQCYSVF